MSDDPARNLALSATDAEAMVDDLLKPAQDVNTPPERVQETEYVAHGATDERVREVVSSLRRPTMEGDSLHVYNDELIPERQLIAATLLETLLAENKALRERCGGHQAQRDRMRARELVAYDNGWTQGKAFFIEDYRAMLRASEEEEG